MEEVKKLGKKSRIKARKKKDVEEHIRKFPRLPGHLTRKDTSYFYLDSGLNVKKMHKMYVLEREAQGKTEHKASLNFYRQIFRQY